MTAGILRPGPDAPGTAPAARCITASVVSHGQGSQVLTLLQRLADTDAGSVSRVIVTHNLPDAGCRPSSRDWPFDLVERVNPTPLGFGANHNRAFAHCDTPFFAVLNPDLGWTDSPWPALLRALDSPGTGLAHPLMTTPTGRPQDHRRAVPTPLRLLARHLLRRADRRADWVCAAFWLVRREAWAALGGFDERFRMYCEDTDFCLRLQLAGWRFAQAEAVVTHEAARRSRRDPRHFGWHVASLWRLWQGAAWQAYRQQRPAPPPR